MSVVQIMVTIIIVTILVTVILGVVSYAAYWFRRVRRPAQAPVDVEAFKFFFRYTPDRLVETGRPNVATDGFAEEPQAASVET